MNPWDQLISFSLAFSCSKWRRLSDDSLLYDDSLSDESFLFTHRVDDSDLLFSLFFFNFFLFSIFYTRKQYSLINRIDRVPRSTCYWQLYCLICTTWVITVTQKNSSHLHFLIFNHICYLATIFAKDFDINKPFS